MKESNLTRSIFTAVICAALLSPGTLIVSAQSPTPNVRPAEPAENAAEPNPSPTETPEAKIPAEQLEALVAPIALYPDPLLSQTLVASTYPLELVQLHQWLLKNKTLKDKALTEAVKKQPWDPSIQAMAALPDVVKWLAEDIQWTTDMYAINKMRFPLSERLNPP